MLPLMQLFGTQFLVLPPAMRIYMCEGMFTVLFMLPSRVPLVASCVFVSKSMSRFIDPISDSAYSAVKKCVYNIINPTTMPVIRVCNSAVRNAVNAIVFSEVWNPICNEVLNRVDSTIRRK